MRVGAGMRMSTSIQGKLGFFFSYRFFKAVLILVSSLCVFLDSVQVVALQGFNLRVIT